MNKIITLLFSCFCLAAFQNLQAQKRYYTINMKQAGTLEQQLTRDEFLKTGSLTIKGPINGTDIKFLHSILSSNYKELPKSKVYRLNLKNARIVPGGESYYTFVDDNKVTHTFYTKKDTVGDYMFNAFRYIKSLTLPDSTYYIGHSACFNMAIQTIDVPAACTGLGVAAFQWCDKMTNIRFMGNKLESIGRLCFYNCENLEGVYLPDCIKNLDDGAFAFCSNISRLRLSENLTQINEMTFYNCKYLQDVVIPEKVKVIRRSAFEYANPTSVTIKGNNLESIEERAFYGCQNITRMNVPNSVYNIMGGSFAGCYGLKRIPINEDNPFFTTIDGSLFSKDSLIMYQLKPDEDMKEYTVPSTVKEIMPYGIAYSAYMTKLHIPENVEIIDDKGIFFIMRLQEIYNASKVPTDCAGVEAFDDDVYENVKLFVPLTSVDLYKEDSIWKHFKNITGVNNVTGIRPVPSANDMTEVARYDMQGKRLTKPTKGWQIVRYRNGSAKKVYEI